MAERHEDAGVRNPDLDGGEDYIGALPDVLLQQVLSLLPSREAVRTCVLAARWRTLWKSVPSIRINSAGEIYRNPLALSMFANYLLLLRDRTALHECEINSYYGGDTEEAFRYIELWMRYAVSCQARVLRVHVKNELKDLCLSNVSLLTQHLARLELCSIEVGGRFLDFLGCPALKVLKMEHCKINAERISSLSLSHLIICYGSFIANGRTRISAPSLVTLELDEFMGYTPLLEPMPSLIRAFLRFGETCLDRCDNGNFFGDCGSQFCGGCSYSKYYYGNHDCVLLQGLSGIKNLELISQSQLFIGRMDFKWHVMFSQLKTLLLSEWCMAADFSGLIYFVQHSQVLERLTLHLKYYEEESAIETEESYNPRSRFLVSKHLKVVEIKCRKEDETIHQIVKILGTHGVPPERINIKPNFHDYGLGCFSFE
ncbi:F-box protein At5g03100 [Lolium perenne]|uniref:F-box protein At5g03100 n=1 Tax=Lolium perenne TaxID=4522 RepID=UPI0021F58D16|nr:F-box protein At5g03100-like isoform X2 [Lolium perenne]